ncbi:MULTISPECIES: hypothetical protein [unclassified Vibrio]|uniref:hypothetical protein n=1 Tax=unclassified Vibrio TaxID=2614977 RepID=UPI00137280ED|nr:MULTISPECIES: hypothetical protein [unclassified Vibrio]NAW68501.1 hypothetical protein [Vibrio sp. V28_P6S34P95]NAX05191.1 hypothetical protein [Vibrio sp. V30_P3S12P165]NAX33731.1 hypothetical protein [Vibrio sp. V29_P1S30P107]NAX36976.1 hypothetical protein [Vibrio sp. V27_P1S3P104]NNN43633.1 hypothetical protein [Vibrio sp. 1-1(7)]
MDFDFYLPCQPEWLCKPFIAIFSLLLLIGLALFIRIGYREYLKIQRAKSVKRQRRVHYRDRKGGKNGRPTNIKK